MEELKRNARKQYLKNIKKRPIGFDSRERSYLCIPFCEKDDAKQKYDIMWDGTKRMWFTYEPTTSYVVKKYGQTIVSLDGEDRLYGGNILFIDLIPKSCWFTNVRSCVTPLSWDKLRHYTYTRTDNKCECCKYDATIGNVSLECHERWSYTINGNQYIQKLERLISLCKSCHESTHMGLSGIRGIRDKAIKHLCYVSNMSEKDAINHEKDAFALHAERSKFNWTLDLSLLTSNGIEISKPPDIHSHGDDLDYIKKNIPSKVHSRWWLHARGALNHIIGLEPVGKWMIFADKEIKNSNNLTELDIMWQVIHESVTNDELTFQAKVSTCKYNSNAPSGGKGVLIIYTYTNDTDINRVANKLIDIFGDTDIIMRYKTDDMTRNGVYSKNGSISSITSRQLHSKNKIALI